MLKNITRTGHRSSKMLSLSKYTPYLTLLMKKTLQKVAEEERNKDDSEYINRGLAKDPKINESGAGETSTGKMQRIPVGSVQVNGERYEIGTRIEDVI